MIAYERGHVAVLPEPAQHKTQRAGSTSATGYRRARREDGAISNHVGLLMRSFLPRSALPGTPCLSSLTHDLQESQILGFWGELSGRGNGRVC